jgi:hypothetical protein
MWHEEQLSNALEAFRMDHTELERSNSFTMQSSQDNLFIDMGNHQALIMATWNVRTMLQAG